MTTLQEIEHRTDFLFASPSFLEGAARTIDIFGNFDTYNRSESPEEADFRAISNDWLVICQDFREAFNRYKAENPLR